MLCTQSVKVSLRNYSRGLHELVDKDTGTKDIKSRFDNEIKCLLSLLVDPPLIENKDGMSFSYLSLSFFTYT
jgi:hypothetical protein